MIEFRVANDTLEDGRAVFVTIFKPGTRIAANVTWGRLLRAEAGQFSAGNVAEALETAQRVAEEDGRPYVAVTLEAGVKWEASWGNLKE